MIRQLMTREMASIFAAVLLPHRIAATQMLPDV